MKRRSFLSIVLATLIPTSLISTETTGTPGTVSITADIEGEYGPYLVSGTIKNNKTGAVTTLNKLVTQGRFEKIIAYQAGHTLTLNITLTAVRSGSTYGYLSINSRVAKLNGDQRVMICNAPQDVAL